MSNFTISANEDEITKIGKGLAKGAFGYVCFWVGSAMLFIMALGWLDILPRDATDSPTERSDMRLLTDHGTGCQYLSRSGVMTPRMGPDGKQICRK